MKAITKAEVEEGIKNRASGNALSDESYDFVLSDKLYLKAGWLLVGYEIARRRVERGEEL